MEFSSDPNEEDEYGTGNRRIQGSVQLSRSGSLQQVLARDYDKDRRHFRIIFFIISIIAGIQTLIIIYILSQWLDGFLWHPDEPQAPDFNVHLVCSILGCIILTAYAILIFRAFPNHSHRKLAVLHTVIAVFVVLITSFGMKIAYDSHHLYGRNHLYSLHSWVGVTIFGLLFFELVTGNWLFFNEVVHGSLTYWHRVCGQMIFLFSVTATISGILTAGTRALGVDIKEKGKRVATLNVFGLLTTIFSVLVRYLYVEYRFRRRPRPGLKEKDIMEHEVVLSIVRNKNHLGQGANSNAKDGES